MKDDKQLKFSRCHKCNKKKRATKMWETLTGDLKTVMLCDKCAREYFELNNL